MDQKYNFDRYGLWWIIRSQQSYPPLQTDRWGKKAVLEASDSRILYLDDQKYNPNFAQAQS